LSDLLVKRPVSDDVIDAAIGEAHVVKEALFNTFTNIFPYQLPQTPNMFEYLSPEGYPPLVELLENKYKAKVVITCGAKQALSAVCYSLNQMGKSTVGLKSPFWCLLPPLIKMHGLDVSIDDYDAYLAVSPNNPSGEMLDLAEIDTFCRYGNSPLIHDAVYYTYSYLPRTIELKQYGDVQIYSASKAFGLSSIRVGFAICSNPEFYKYIKEYVEMTTVGVSIASQMFLFEILNQMEGYPTLVEKFENAAFRSLQKAKQLVKTIDPDVLQVPENMKEIAGMFLFCKTGSKFDAEKAKVSVIDGEPFGAPGYIRMNLALPFQQMEEAVKRLNSLA
jgi:aspartate/methionine/tyrosine aminotransferase